jgi:regulation of enolase protein 1 (concanavalin A-like superfamily)
MKSPTLAPSFAAAGHSRFRVPLVVLLALHVSGLVSAQSSAPAVPVIVGISPDSGRPNDGVTNVTNPNLDGTAEPNVTITVLTFANSSVVGTTTSDASGTWSLPIQINPAAVGAYYYVAKATNSAGVSSGTSATFQVYYGSSPDIFLNLRRAEVGKAVDIDVGGGVVGGTWPTGYDVTVSGLPPGLTFTGGSNGGHITGTPTTPGAYRVTVAVLNGGGSVQKTNTVWITAASATPSPLQSTDIGTTVAGSTSSSGGATTVAGSGADIWGAADGFHFHAQALNGDGTITARLVSLQNTFGWAKAGVMIRESMAVNAANVFVAGTPDHGIVTQYRNANGDGTGQIAGPAVGTPRWLRLTRKGTTFTGASSADGVTWTSFEPITVAAMSVNAYVGLAVTSHADGTLCSAVFDNITINGATTTPPPPPPPPSSWSFADIGAITVAGSNVSSGNTITIRGSGSDVWDNADACRFVWLTRTGDGVVEAKIASMQDTNSWAKAGVMIRESNDPGARNVYLALTPSWNGIIAQARTATGSSTTGVAGPGVTAPYWLRVARAGNTFTASASGDGMTWQTITTFQVAMNATANFGFAVTSHDTTKLNEAVFSDPFVGTR